MSDEKLDKIVNALSLGRQRATYGAVAALVDRPPTFLMQGRPRDPRHSWVMNKETGLPTGYDREQMHADLEVNPEVLSTETELRHWRHAQMQTARE